MTFTRAQMIEAWLDGTRCVHFHHPKWSDVEAPKWAAKYVDSLQDAKNVPFTEVQGMVTLNPAEAAGTAIFHRLDGLPELTAAILALSTVTENARETDENARGKSDLPKHREFSIQDIYNQLGEIREQLLKSQERELVLAKVVGSLGVKILFAAQMKPNGETAFMEFIGETARQLTRVFPELTPEE